MLSFPLISQDLIVKDTTYTGNGTALSITGIGFQPEYVIIKGNAATGCCWKVASLGGDSSYVASITTAVTDGIKTLDADGFTLGANTAVNSAATTYYATAIAGDKIYTGKYVGTGGTRKIATAFKPILVILRRDGVADVYKTSSVAGTNSGIFLVADAGNHVTGLDTDGFNLGTTSNAAGENGYWMAIDSSGYENYFDRGSYTGNNTDNRNISMSVAWQPTMVVVDRSTISITSIWRNEKVVGDAGLRFDAASNLANTIQSIGTGVFQVGTNPAVNADTETYYYFAFRSYTAPTPSRATKPGLPKIKKLNSIKGYE